jgi:hypothetical protein
MMIVSNLAASKLPAKLPVSKPAESALLVSTLLVSILLVSTPLVSTPLVSTSPVSTALVRTPTESTPTRVLGSPPSSRPSSLPIFQFRASRPSIRYRSPSLTPLAGTPVAP